MSYKSDFNHLVWFLRCNGCRVILCNKKLLLLPNTKNQKCYGYFWVKSIHSTDYPFIYLATKGYSYKEKLMVLGHEAGHIKCLAETPRSDHQLGKAWDIYDQWIDGTNYSDSLLRKVRRIILLSEYTADRDSYGIFRDLGLSCIRNRDFVDLLILSANLYSLTLRWSFGRRVNYVGTMILVAEQKKLGIRNKWLSRRELLTEPSDKTLKLMDRYFVENGGKL